MRVDEGPSRTVAYAAAELRGRISRGTVGSGERMPGERALADDIGVSRTTLRAALGVLQREGIVDGMPQRGWFVRGGGRFADRSGELESFTEIARARGFEPRSRVLRRESGTATVDESERLSIPPGAGVIRLTRLRMLDGVPLCLDDSLLAAAGAGPVLEVDLETASLYAVLQERCGVTVVKSNCTLRARKAEADEAERLRMPVGDPVLEQAALTLAVDGSVALASTVVYRGDAYRFQAELFRSTPFG